MSIAREELVREARRRGLIPNEELSGMEKLAEFGRGALGDVADTGRAALGTFMEKATQPDFWGGDWKGTYESYKQIADDEEKAVAQKNPGLSKALRRAGLATGIVAGGGGAAAGGKGLAKATTAALRRGASRVKTSGAAMNAGIGGTMGALDPDTNAVQGAVEGVIAGGIAGKILGGEKVKALKNLAVNTPIGRMSISQLAKQLGVSNSKAAALWYAMHPVSRRGIERAAAAIAGKED